MTRYVFSINFKSETPAFVRPELLRHPPIPWPMWGTNPRRLFGKVWWDKERKAAFVKNNNCCWACGRHRLDTPEQWLEGHETYKTDYQERTQTYTGTVGLCRDCHAYIHRQMRASPPWNPTKVERAIDKRALRLLSDAGLIPLVLVNSPPETNQGWCLVFEGDKYWPAIPVGTQKPTGNGGL